MYFCSIKKAYVMKIKVLLLLTITAAYVASSPKAAGQIPYDYALGGINLTPTESVVRTIDQQRIIASYKHYGGPYMLTRVSLSGIIRAKLDDYHRITDIRIVDDEVFFCGYKRDNRYSFLGHANIADIESMNPHFTIEEVWIDSTSQTLLYRLAAYKDASGTYRIVAIGEFGYNSTFTYSAPHNAYPCPSSTSCVSSFVIEYNYSGTFSHVGNAVLHDRNSFFEVACDVVETDNYVAVVAYNDKDQLIIHTSPKGSSFFPGAFNNFSYYSVLYQEGNYHCCHMKGDTIALVSVFALGGGPSYETHLRVIDLASMLMTNAQTFNLLTKEEPMGVTYMPDYAKLVLLQNHKYNATEVYDTYFFLKPYESSTYIADEVYDASNNSFLSLDRLTSKHIVSGGGGYWNLKDVSFNNMSNCYKVRSQTVNLLTTASHNTNAYPYLSIIPISRPSIVETYDFVPITSYCITNYPKNDIQQ